MFITACGEKFQFSDTVLKAEDGKVYLVGKVKNVSGKKCGYLRIDYELKSGTFTKTGYFTDYIENGETHDYEWPVDDIKPSEIKAYTSRIAKYDCELYE